MIRKIATVAVYVANQAQAIDFWTEQVGFQIHRSKPIGPEALWVEVGPAGAESSLVLYPKSMMTDWDERKPSLVFECDDVQATYEQLQARGVTFTQPPQQLPWGAFAMFADPDGNAFGLRGSQSE